MIGKLISKICPIFMVPENNPVNEVKYLGNKKNNPSIYEEENNKYIYPLIKFKNEQLLIEKLCLIDFQGDTRYKCIELQQVKQENSIHYIVLMAGQKAQTDIYYTTGLKINADSYTSLLNKVTLNEIDSIKVHFEATEKGIDVYLSFKDSEKRSIEFKIKENKNKIDSFGLIAPVGNMSENPDKFPVIYLKKFNMVEQKGTAIFVKINGKNLKPVKLFPLCNFKRVYLARYSYFNNIKELNNDYMDIMEPVEVTKDVEEIRVDNCIYSTIENNGHSEIKSVAIKDSNSEMRISFSPAIPNIISLKNNTEVKGHFSIGVDEVKGIMGGVYSINKSMDAIVFKMNPEKGWQPMPGKLWMKTYFWNCDIKIVDNKLHVKSKWKRNEIILTYDMLKAK
ncbi:hypothetical protein G9F73_008815 [Clostridium estertheticum]|uniref:hypothetical protein n=1 Tax=Clostridium estertheticum TaxID=238834 RepID=UPI0013EE6B6A|nr:hypothetical protein [Clostridium estertheticum]MBZ9607907.1 hypothetical protein [Clostridium estertheticum]